MERIPNGTAEAPLDRRRERSHHCREARAGHHAERRNRKSSPPGAHGKARQQRFCPPACSARSAEISTSAIKAQAKPGIDCQARGEENWLSRQSPLEDRRVISAILQVDDGPFALRPSEPTCLQTKKIQGLYENDFITAAKLDKIPDQVLTAGP
jgi:hypothetical protein